MTKRYLIVLRDRRGRRYEYGVTATDRDDAIDIARQRAQHDYGSTGRFQSWSLVSVALIDELTNSNHDT